MSAAADYLELEDIESETGRILRKRDTLTVESAVTLFEKGDVLFGKLRPYLEKYYRAEFSGKCTGEILAFKPERIIGSFLFYCVASPWFIEKCNALAYGAKMPRVNWSKQLAQFVLPVPERREQECVSAYLDAGCRAIEATVMVKRRQIEVLDGLRKTTITKAVTCGVRSDVDTRPSGQEWLGPVPRHWSVASLKRLLQEPMSYGLNEPAELEDRDLPRYVRITDFDDSGRLREDTFRSLPREVANRAMLRQDDVLFARSGATVGKTFIFRDYRREACFAGYLVRARTARWKLSPLFLYLFTKSLAYERWKELTFTQATIQNISAARYNYLTIPLPPLPEQVEICRYVERRVVELEALKKLIIDQIAVLNSLRKSMIQECTTGQRRIAAAATAQTGA